MGKFPETIIRALDAPRKYARISAVLGTIPQPAKGQRDPEVVDLIKKRPDVKVFKITRNNRDELFPKVYKAVRESLGLGEPGTTKAALRRKEKLEELKRQEEARQQEEEEKEK